MSKQNTCETIKGIHQPATPCKLSLKTKLLDFSISFLVVAPITVLYWRGTWALFNIYVFPQSQTLISVVSSSCGFSFLLIFILLEHKILTHLENQNRIIKRTVWGLAFYLVSIAAVASWRGLWMLLDEFTTTSLLSALVSHFVGFFGVTISKTASSVVTAPGFVVKDNLGESGEFRLPVQEVGNWLKTRLISQQIYFTINCFFTVLIIGAAVVLYWRGTWVFLNNLNNPFTSTSTLLHEGLISLGIGTGICSVFFWISEPLGITVAHAQWPYKVKVLADTVFVYALGFGAVNFWRGFWYLGDYLLLPVGRPILIAWLSHGLSIVLLSVGRGMTNLAGAPAGCRMHEHNTLEGFYMGSYLELTQPPRIPDAENSLLAPGERVSNEKIDGASSDKTGQPLH